ncbi:multiple PDZ domain protein-like [Hyposmocoma kahamanoa]|uniref:multiple PDZ domain protein-like n=1 Tax=Hyposmocoma kahamanoa TaxID=1477025 RepID=UPI000E6D7162|nr:multiple PDZ domain protein-like [Hyposmocoma kahamanoa]
MAEAKGCKYCEVIRDMLEVPSSMRDRRMSAPALVNLKSSSETEEEELLLVPVVNRRKSAGPLKFLVPSRRPSFCPSPTMTVTVSPDRRADAIVAQRWGPARKVALQRIPGEPLGVSIVGGKVDIVSTTDSDDGEEKAIFGIFIKNVVPDSPAGNCGELHTGDRILEVDGVCVRSAQHERAVQLIKAAGEKVTLTVQSLLAWNTDSSDVEVSSPPPTPTHIARKSPVPPPHPDDVPEHEIKIDRASAGAIKRSKEEKEADQEEEDDFGYTTMEGFANRRMVLVDCCPGLRLTYFHCILKARSH